MVRWWGHKTEGPAAACNRARILKVSADAFQNVTSSPEATRAVAQRLHTHPERRRPGCPAPPPARHPPANPLVQAASV